MKLIINIPEYVIDDMKECGFIPEEDNEELCKAIDNGTPILNNATNGDVIKAMFGVKEIDMSNTYGVHFPEEEDYSHYFFKGWWDAPYQKGGKDEY